MVTICWRVGLVEFQANRLACQASAYEPRSVNGCLMILRTSCSQLCSVDTDQPYVLSAFENHRIAIDNTSDARRAYRRLCRCPNSCRSFGLQHVCLSCEVPSLECASMAVISAGVAIPMTTSLVDAAWVRQHWVCVE